MRPLSEGLFGIVVRNGIAVAVAAAYGYLDGHAYVTLVLLVALPFSTARLVYATGALALIVVLLSPLVSSVSPTELFLLSSTAVAVGFAASGRGDWTGVRVGSKHARWLSSARRIQLLLAWLLIASLLFRASPLIVNGCLALLLLLVRHGSRNVVQKERRTLAELAKAGVRVLVFALCLLIFVKIFTPQTPLIPRPPRLTESHPEYLYRLKANARVTRKHWVSDTETTDFRIRTSSQGLRDREFGPKVDNEFRIVLLGDSFTFGYSVEDDQTISAFLETLLADAGLPYAITWLTNIFRRASLARLRLKAGF